MAGFRRKCAKSQSAMEYLMTYGWAILIIAVVLAALFQLGLFSGVFAPRAQPSSCRVIRPLGAGTSAYASLQGVCSGLLPEFVAQFNGQSYISAGNPNILRIDDKSFTLSVWIKPALHLSASGARSTIAATYNPGWILDIGKDTSEFYRFHNGTNAYTYTPPGNQFYLIWTHFVVTRDISTNTIVMYLNGTRVKSFTSNYVLPSSNPLWIGKRSDGNNFNGLISNFQVYNTSLSANEVMALYQDGIGGAPILVQNLVGWWPLNGNANDTSGNLDNGAPSGVAYTSSWTSGYALH